MHRIDRYGMRVVLDFLGESIGQSGEPANLHPHGEILALGIARGDVPRVRLTHDALDLASDAFSRLYRVSSWLDA